MFQPEMKPGNASYQRLWLSLTLLPLLFIAFLLPLTPQDYWWYLRLGQDILTTGSIPAADVYSSTQAGMPFFYHSWLSAVVFWKIYQAGGFFLTFLTRGVVIAITYGVLFFLARNAGAGPRLAGLVTFLAALAGSSNWSFRPQLFTYPLFVLALYVLWRWARGEDRGLWILPVIALLWVNLHGSFPLLFFLISFAFLFGSGNRRKLLIVAGLSAGAIFINPHGIETIAYVQNMLSSQSNRFSVEWAPMVNQGWQANLFFAWLLIFAPLAAFSSHKMSALEWAYFLSFGWLALSGMRYVIWFLFIVALLTAALLSGLAIYIPQRPVQRENARLNNAVALFLLLLPLIALPGIREAWWSEAPRPYASSNPIDATHWLVEHPELAGPLFSDLSYSSYLIFALPSRPVWIDPRFELYPAEQWKKYTAIASASLQWQNLLDEEGINLVMLSKAGEPFLVSAMRETAQWCEDYQDETAVIFRRDSQCP
jgi:hypothetical protein